MHSIFDTLMNKKKQNLCFETVLLPNMVFIPKYDVMFISSTFIQFNMQINKELIEICYVIGKLWF